MDDLERELMSLGNLEDDDDDDSFDDICVKSLKKKKKLHQIKTPLEETARESGFHQSSRLCLEHIRDAMLHHRWQEAAKYMACFPQMLVEADSSTGIHVQKERIWRLSTEILHHLPNSKLKDYNIIYELMKHSGPKHYLMICLEHSFHLLLSGSIEDAKQQLSIAESWRHGKESAAQYQKTKLINAYRSLLDYIIWSNKKLTHSSTDDLDKNQEMNSYFRQASVNLKEILKNPGIWDPFILSYVEMLEFYEDHEEALRVLSDYAYDNNFPPNPNAFVYLYEYLKRHDTSDRKLMKVLKILHVLVPSHELMLEYSSLLLHSEKQNDVQKALGVVLEMLDFACWRNNLAVWQHLKAIIKELKSRTGCQGFVARKMAERKEWWPMLHFTSFHANRDFQESKELVEVKASLIRDLHLGKVNYRVPRTTRGAQN